MSDGTDPPGLNPGIVRTVAALNAAGFTTVDSGDGQTHDHHCDRDHGYVVCVVAEPLDMVAEARRLADVVADLGLIMVPAAMEAPEPGCVTVEASYSPSDNLAIINLSHVHDRFLGRPRTPSRPPTLRVVK